MSEEPNPLQPKPRLPYEQASAPRARTGTGKVWAAIYAAIAIVFVSAAGYMHIGQRLGLMEPQVLFPSLGAVWFGIRAALALRAQPGGSDARG